MNLLEFECRTERFALPLETVRRVIPSALPVPLPGAPQIVVGLLNLGGLIVSVIDLWPRLGLPANKLKISQRLVVTKIDEFLVAFPVDQVRGITEREVEDISSVPARGAAACFVTGMARLEDGLCIICDPEKFLLDEEKGLLGAALRSSRNGQH